MENKEKKKGFAGFVDKYLNTGLLIGGMISALLAWGEMNTRLFSSSTERVLTEEHMKVPVNPVSVFLQGDTLKKQGNILTGLIIDQNDLIVDQNKMLDSISKGNIKRDSITVADEGRKNVSRNKRDSVNVLILSKLLDIEFSQRIQGVALDSLKNN
tara:strand:+ start:76035 stop:76502 length:468 start_codon:yes stop_codon:yes gene_type:complete